MSKRKITPKPPQKMTKTEYARHRGVTLQAVRRALADGRAVADADGQVLVLETDRRWLQTRIEMKSTTAKAPPAVREGAASQSLRSVESDEEITAATAPGAFVVAKARRERAAAATAELVLAETQRRLVDRAAVEREVGSMLIGVRGRLMAMTSRVAATLAAETDPARVRLLLVNELSEAMDV